jgi:flagellar basal-body rod protein FlgC
MSFWNMLQIGASALSAQRLRMDVISNNIANSETTRTESGGPYQRQDVVFQTSQKDSFLPAFIRARHVQDAMETKVNGVTVSQIVTDDTPGSKVYEPTHPDADENGYVTYPNVNIVVEMTNMLSATRSYEANLTVVDMAKRMAMKALDIGS